MYIEWCCNLQEVYRQRWTLQYRLKHAFNYCHFLLLFNWLIFIYKTVERGLLVCDTVTEYFPTFLNIP